jgi:general stress protein YciG
MAGPKEAQEQYNDAANKGGGRKLDSEIAEKNHQRVYNPVDEAKRGRVSESINNDAGKMRYPVENGN